MGCSREQRKQTDGIGYINRAVWSFICEQRYTENLIFELLNILWTMQPADGRGFLLCSPLFPPSIALAAVVYS